MDEGVERNGGRWRQGKGPDQREGKKEIVGGKGEREGGGNGGRGK